MTNTVAISCTLDTTNPLATLGFELYVDDQKFFDTDHVQAQQKIVLEIADDDGEHELRFILKNKTSNHTQIDEAGNIVSDARLIVKDLAFDEIQLGHIVTEQAVYTHSQNNHFQSTVEDKFYGEMGCNGTVSLKFSTPIYLWLLEQM
jgi:hypothetical protein